MKALSDLTAPATVKRKLLEKDIQKKCVDWARAHGWWARKFSSQSQRSVPDYLFAKNVGAGYYATKIAVEFKRLGATSTDAQKEEQVAMSRAGWHVYEIDDFELFVRMIRYFDV